MLSLDFRDYLRFAEKYLALAEDDLIKEASTDWLLIPSVILAWSAIESFVNGRLEDFKSVPKDMFQLHEQAFLSEQRIRFVDKGQNIGEFVIEGTEYRRLEEKIFFLFAKSGFGNKKNIKSGTLWQDFENFKNLRDAIAHPKRNADVMLSIEVVGKHIATAKAVIQLISEGVWGTPVNF